MAVVTSSLHQVDIDSSNLHGNEGFSSEFLVDHTDRYTTDEGRKAPRSNRGDNIKIFEDNSPNANNIYNSNFLFE